MVRVAWARLKCEVFIEGPGLVVFGMHQQRPGADGFGRFGSLPRLTPQAVYGLIGAAEARDRVLSVCCCSPAEPSRRTSSHLNSFRNRIERGLQFLGATRRDGQWPKPVTADSGSHAIARNSKTALQVLWNQRFFRPSGFAFA
jgi:hypothetical protein